MKLSQFIKNNGQHILEEWEKFAGEIYSELDPRLLRDHAAEMLEAITDDMEAAQGENEQTAKSKGVGQAHAIGQTGAHHAIHRLETGFTLFQVVSEYRYLRACVLSLWGKIGQLDADGITRFNESIDEALVEAVKKYSSVSNKNRNDLLGILGHDLKNPLAAITMGSQLLTKANNLNDHQVRIAMRLFNTSHRMHRMLDYLLDLIRIQQHRGLPINPVPCNLDIICQQIIGEIGMAYTDHVIGYHTHGNLNGVWDPDRLAQVLSNIIANALKHGERDGEVIVETRDLYPLDKVMMRIHNFGIISPTIIHSIFNRRIDDDTPISAGTGMGLGLFVARAIVASHGGTIEVVSNPQEGTTFIISLPRDSRSQDQITPGDVKEPQEP